MEIKLLTKSETVEKKFWLKSCRYESNGRNHEDAL